MANGYFVLLHMYLATKIHIPTGIMHRATSELNQESHSNRHISAIGQPS